MCALTLSTTGRSRELTLYRYLTRVQYYRAQRMLRVDKKWRKKYGLHSSYSQMYLTPGQLCLTVWTYLMSIPKYGLKEGGLLMSPLLSSVLCCSVSQVQCLASLSASLFHTSNCSWSCLDNGRHVGKCDIHWLVLNKLRLLVLTLLC